MSKEEIKLKNLIGYKLENIDDKEIIVSKDNKQYVLKFEKYEGDCCSYNILKTNLLIDENNKPVITNIKIEEEQSGKYNGCGIVITFFGENKQIATIESCSSSGSGWCYGACVSIKCKELNIDEIITEW